MKINHYKYLLLLFLIFSFCKQNIRAYQLTNNSFFDQTYNHKKDSALASKYNFLIKEYKNQKYYKTLKEALRTYSAIKKTNNYKYTYLFSLLIADVYDKTRNHKQSLHYYKESFFLLENQSINEISPTIIESIDDETPKVILRIGSSFQKLGLKDSAIFYYKKLENFHLINDNILKYKAASYSNLSGIYEQDSIYDKALNYAIKAIDIHKSRNNRVNLANSLNNLGNIYLSQSNYSKAKKTYLEGIELIQNDNSQNAVRFKANLYYNLAWAMRKLKDYKAYDFQELSYEIEDSQREKETRRIIAEVTARHEENLKQQKIELIKHEVQLEETQQAKTSILFAALSLLVLVISGVIIYNYKLRQKNLRLKLSETNLLQQQNLEKVKSESQIKILNATIDGKETERKLIAEILHDNVSALLSSANMHLTATKKQFIGETPQEIEKTQAIISEASQKVRDLSHNLVSSILLKFGLEYAIKDVVKKYSNSQLKLDVSAHNIGRYNQEFEIKIFNVIQELINNILKHSKAQYAQIDLKEEKNQLTVLVKDDGVGFSTSSPSFSDGIGLNQVEARIHIMNGKLTITSKENIGASIHIIVPIVKKEKDFKLTSVS
ncbi:tetratricopeptide repeat-containing sensor histidine kinase [Tenacibaculum sediminilitoris]|uniref:tetratricopeptide repeat-containing sensor histidine kinase n=1 Tax=Tenacibaculum sediminilitoris TaxID=1820334 RepID=UPI0038B613C8